MAANDAISSKRKHTKDTPDPNKRERNNANAKDSNCYVWALLLSTVGGMAKMRLGYHASVTAQDPGALPIMSLKPWGPVLHVTSACCKRTCDEFC